MPEPATKNDLIELRAAHQVRLADTSEEGFASEQLPGGIYGFTYAPQEAAVPLFSKKAWHSFEVHKLPDGSQHLVGFVSSKEAGLIRSGLRVEVTLFPEPWEESIELVSVPMSRMVPSKRGPSREGGNGLRLELL